jgi:hypothetical protein
MPLDAVRQRTALQRIAAWRSEPQRPLACSACGLDETLHVALGPPVPPLD